MATNLERLHSVVEGKIGGRRCGKTFARIHELASNLELGLFVCGVVIISKYADMSYILPMILEIFKERGLPPLKMIGKFHIQCGNTFINFVTQDNYAGWVCGRDNFFVVPMTHWD